MSSVGTSSSASTCDHQDGCDMCSLSTSSSTGDLTLPAPDRSVTDKSISNSGNQSDGAKSEQLRMASLARHVKISGIDKRPVMPVGLSNTAVGVVKDRCTSINTSLERQQSVEVPEFTTKLRREENMGNKIQHLSQRFESERLQCRNTRIKTASAGAVQPHDINQIGLVSTTCQNLKYSMSKLPQFGDCQHTECSNGKPPNFGSNSQRTNSSERERQSESISRLIGG